MFFHDNKFSSSFLHFCVSSLNFPVISYLHEIIATTKNQNVIVHHLNLSSFKSIREFATKIVETEPRLDCLIHNAGYANYLQNAVSEDGIEITMATNHYGPFLLTHLLIDLMRKTAKENKCRIVVVASKTHTLSFMDPTKEYDLNPINHFPSSSIYGNSKFANFLFTFELSRRLEGSNITANCLHPGVVDTGIWRHIPFPINYLYYIVRKLFLKTLNEGIQTILYCAMSPDLENVNGKYFRDCKEGKPREDVNNIEWQTAMWKASQKLVKLNEFDPKI